jgi:calcium/calmodulin-dependent protein kinase I
MSIPDLIADSKLEAVVHSGWVRHTYRRRGTPGKHWIVDVTETWVRKSRLGAGGYGTVWLEECQEPASKDGPRLRAVKEIQIDPQEDVDYNRELLAIAKFSLPKVSLSRLPCLARRY